MFKRLLWFVMLSSMLCSEAVQLRIMTFNIRRDGKEEYSDRKWRNRKTELLTFIHDQQPDIFCLQEVTADQLNDFIHAFSDYQYVGKGRGSAWAGLSLNEYNPIFFNKKKFRRIANKTKKGKEHTFRINKPGWFFDTIFKGGPVNSGWLWRICTWVLLQDLQTGKIFYVYNTHLDNEYEKARINGIKTISKVMREKERKMAGLPTLLMGDFNTPIEGKFARKLKQREPNFINTRACAALVEGLPETANHWGEKPGTAIDHILIKNLGKGRVLSHKTWNEIKQPYLSDHWPVMVDIEL